MNAPVNPLEAHRAAMNDVLGRQKAAHLRDGPPSVERRIDWLNRSIDLLIGHQAEIAKAVNADFGSRSPEATALTDVAGSIGPLKFAREHVAKWMRPQKRKTTPAILGLFGAKAMVQYQPKGVVGILGTWNFPVNTVLSPLASVLAAGNRALHRQQGEAAGRDVAAHVLLEEESDAHAFESCCAREARLVQRDGAAHVQHGGLPSLVELPPEEAAVRQADTHATMTEEVRRDARSSTAR